MAMPKSARVSVSRRTSQRTFWRCAPTATRMPISRVRRYELLTYYLRDRFRGERVFVPQRLDLVVHCPCERFGRFIGAHYEIAPLLRILEIGKKNDRRGRTPEIENSGIADNAYDFDILIVRHEAEANRLSDSISIREKVFRESAVHDGETRVLFIVGLLKVAAAKQLNSECSEKAPRNRRCIGHEAGACVQIGRRSRYRVMPDFRRRDRRG